VDCLEKDASIMAKYCVALLNRLKEQLVTNRRGRLLKGILFLHDNCAHHKEAIITHKKLAHLHFEVLKCPDLASLDYGLFCNLKGRKFLSTEEAR
jgi:hypothetical protein